MVDSIELDLGCDGHGVRTGRWFSVFDGHGGWQCSDYAHKKLHTILQVELFNHLGSPDDKDDEAKEESSVDAVYSTYD